MRRREHAVRYLPDLPPAVPEHDLVKVTGGTAPPPPSSSSDDAVKVGRAFVRSATQHTGPVVVTEVWIDPVMALCVRYRHGTLPSGRRVADVLADPFGSGARNTVAVQGALLFESMYDGPVRQGEFADRSGHAWWGDEPAAGWAAVDSPDRVATVLPAPSA